MDTTMGVKSTNFAKKVRKRGRPSTGFNKNAYMKEYMRKKRAEKKQDEKRA
jgi:hypothetical protein